jgi:hypothetical protein
MQFSVTGKPKKCYAWTLAHLPNLDRTPAYLRRFAKTVDELCQRMGSGTSLKARRRAFATIFAECVQQNPVACLSYPPAHDLARAILDGCEF